MSLTGLASQIVPVNGIDPLVFSGQHPKNKPEFRWMPCTENEEIDCMIVGGARKESIPAAPVLFWS